MLSVKLMRRAVSVSVASMLLIGSAATFAEAIATSYLNVTDFKFVHAGTDNKLLNGTDITIPGGRYTASGDTTAELNGTSDSNTETANPGVGNQFDVAASCVGDCTYVENSFAHLGVGDPATSDYARGDLLLTGQSIARNLGEVAEAGADRTSLSEVSLATSPGDGSVPGNNLIVGATAVYSALVDLDIQVKFDIEYLLRATVSPDAAFGAANAVVLFAITLTDITEGGVVKSAPLANVIFDSLNASAGEDFNSPFSDSVILNYTLKAGHTYKFQAIQTVVADATLVPEPGSLALLGAGLLTLGAFRRRKKLAA